MATKNFFFSLGASSLILLSACATHTTPVYEPQGPYAHYAPPPVPAQTPQTQQNPLLAGGASPSAPAAQPIYSGVGLPVGVFLSAGAMRSYAHIGVLRALQKAQLPIVAVGGVEWGSVVAASFSQTRKANQVEWEMMKLKKEQLPTDSSLNRELSDKDLKELFSFLRFAFADRDLEKGFLPFMCPANDGTQTVFINSGKARDQLQLCTAFPPLFGFVPSGGKNWIAAAAEPGDWAGELKKAGAQYLIYVDVINKGTLLHNGKYTNDSNTRALWMSVRAASNLQHSFANTTIEIPLDMDILDFDQRRNAMVIGEQVTNSYVADILKAVGL